MDGRDKPGHDALCHPAFAGPTTRVHSLAINKIGRLRAMVKVKCPHCGQIHELSVRETYISLMARCRMLSAGSLPRLSGSFDDGKNWVMIYGPKNVGTNIIEFIAQTGGDDRDTQGRRLSAPRETVPRDGGRV